MFAIHYLKKMAASFFTDRNSNRKKLANDKECNLRQVRNRSLKESRYRSNKKNEDKLSKKIKTNCKKKSLKMLNRRKKVKDEISSTTTNGSLEATNLLENLTNINLQTNSKTHPLGVGENGGNQGSSIAPISPEPSSLDTLRSELISSMAAKFKVVGKIGSSGKPNYKSSSLITDFYPKSSSLTKLSSPPNFSKPSSFYR